MMMMMMMTDYPGDYYADHNAGYLLQYQNGDDSKHEYLSDQHQYSQFDLINAKKRDKKGYKNSGQIVVKSVKIEQVRMIEPRWWKL